MTSFISNKTYMSFKKLASKVTKEYEKKGDTAKTAKKIGQKVAGKIANKKKK